VASDADAPLGETPAHPSGEGTGATIRNNVVRNPWGKFGPMQELRAFVWELIILTTLCLLAIIGIFAALNVESLSSSGYVQFVVLIGATLGLVAALFRLVAHNRSVALDFLGKWLGFWAAAIAVVALLIGGEAWPF
jgi:hypothetical protein